MAVFIWIPSFSTAVDEEPGVLTAKFGDQYQQRVADGINTIAKQWQVVFNGRNNAEMAAIRAFLKTQAGVTAFDWTDPDGETGKYICRKIPRNFVGIQNNSLSVLFEQVFE